MVGTGSGGVMGGRVHEGALIVQGKLQTHRGFFQTRPLPKDVHEKTLEVWLRMEQLEQCCGAVIMLRTAEGDVFDSISIGERGMSQWISGSEEGTRTRGMCLIINFYFSRRQLN